MHKRLFGRNRSGADIKAEAEAALMRSEKLYNDMREAILDKDYQQMKTVIRNRDYAPNRVGAGDMRTALHTAAHENDRESLLILLGQESIDANVKTSKGLTPFLLAASKGKMVAFEVLLNDKKVNRNARDNEDQSALELINDLGKEIKAKKAKELLEKRRNEPSNVKCMTKLAILIGNSNYRENHDPKNLLTWGDLPGAKKDILDMEARMLVEGYKVEKIEDSLDVLEAVQKVMNKTPVASISHLQVLYVGRSSTL